MKISKLLCFSDQFQNNLKLIKNSINNVEIKIISKLKFLHKKIYQLLTKVYNFKGINKDISF